MDVDVCCVCVRCFGLGCPFGIHFRFRCHFRLFYLLLLLLLDFMYICLQFWNYIVLRDQRFVLRPLSVACGVFVVVCCVVLVFSCLKLCQSQKARVPRKKKSLSSASLCNSPFFPSLLWWVCVYMVRFMLHIWLLHYAIFYIYSLYIYSVSVSDITHTHIYTYDAHAATWDYVGMWLSFTFTFTFTFMFLLLSFLLLFSSG